MPLSAVGVGNLAGVIEVGGVPGDWADAAGNHPAVVAPAGNVRNATASTVVERFPAECPNGHALVRPNLQIYWLPCSCALPAAGHRSIRCRLCGGEWFRPAHTDRFKAADHWASRTTGGQPQE